MPLQRLDQFGFHHTLDATRGTALVCFTAPHCGACKAMRMALMRLGEARPDIHLFEVDSPRDAALAQEFDPFHLPALFLYEDGEYHAPIQCAPRVPKLVRTLEQQLQQPPQEAP